eukprot:90080-Rhodomonas_salina.2
MAWAGFWRSFLPLQDWPFPDGDPPPDAIIVRWLSLVKQTFDDKKSASAGKSALSCCPPSSRTAQPNPRSGLGLTWSRGADGLGSWRVRKGGLDGAGHAAARLRSN